MAILKQRVKMGVFYPVENKNRESTAAYRYNAIKLQYEDSGKEVWCLFTDVQLNKLRVREMPELMHKMTPGHLYKLKEIKHYAYLVRVTMPDGKDKVYKLSDSVVHMCICRAANNPEDIPKQSFLDDLMD